jgi:YidC/Oxa1 family membrane protein insertase
LPETRNPHLQPRNSRGNGELISPLTFTLLVCMLLFGYQYLHKSKPSASKPTSQVQSQTLQAETNKAPAPAVGGESIEPTGNFGLLTFIANPLYRALRFLHGHGIGNWGWSIISFTVIFNMLTFWPRIMSMRSSLKMMRVQPKVDALKNRYAHLKINDPKRAEMNAEIMALYKAEGANMFGGCLPLLLQMPLLFAYMSVLRNAAELHRAHWLWLADLSLPDPLHILPLLIIASMSLTQCITPATAIHVLPAADARDPHARCNGVFSLALRLGPVPLLGHRQPYQPAVPVGDQSQQDGQGNARPCGRARHDKPE